MINILKSVSFALLLFAANITAAAQGAFSIAEDAVSRYGFRLERGEAQLTGICLLRADGDTIRGSLVNEFGIKAMDFEICGGKKVRLDNVISFLDKWYIRRTIKSDLRKLFSDNGGTVAESDGSITFENQKRGLKYVFTPLEEEERTVDETAE